MTPPILACGVIRCDDRPVSDGVTLGGDTSRGMARDLTLSQDSRDSPRNGRGNERCPVIRSLDYDDTSPQGLRFRHVSVTSSRQSMVFNHHLHEVRPDINCYLLPFFVMIGVRTCYPEQNTRHDSWRTGLRRTLALNPDQSDQMPKRVGQTGADRTVCRPTAGT